MRKIFPKLFVFATLFSFFSLTIKPFNYKTTASCDFLMDVMKPLGMPLVTFYHSVRESVFLNTRIQNAGFLESIADFFLMPSHFLFAGKTLGFSNESPLIIRQSFDYDNLYWVKTGLSFLVLPVSQPLGICFKGLAYLGADVRSRHRAIEALLKAPLKQSNLETYRKRGISSFHSEEFIPCQEYKRPSTLTTKQKVEMEAFKEIMALFKAHGILYWLDCGSCLGAYRYGGVIPWDIDIDIAIFQEDHDNVKRLLASLDPDKYQIPGLVQL